MPSPMSQRRRVGILAARVLLDERTEHVGDVLVEGAGLALVAQPGRVLGDTVGEFVPDDAQRVGESRNTSPSPSPTPCARRPRTRCRSGRRSARWPRAACRRRRSSRVRTPSRTARRSRRARRRPHRPAVAEGGWPRDAPATGEPLFAAGVGDPAIRGRCLPGNRGRTLVARGMLGQDERWSSTAASTREAARRAAAIGAQRTWPGETRVVGCGDAGEQ